MRLPEASIAEYISKSHIKGFEKLEKEVDDLREELRYYRHQLQVEQQCIEIYRIKAIEFEAENEELREENEMLKAELPGVKVRLNALEALVGDK